MNVPEGNNSRESKEETVLDPEQTPAPNVARSNSSRPELLFLPNSCGNIVPKHIATFDEKYVLRCLELLHNCALRAAAPKLLTNPRIMAAKLAIERPNAGRQSVIDILRSPLVQNFDSNFGRKDLVEPVCSDILKPEMEVFESPPRHKRLLSISSTTTACSDKSSSSGSATSFQGLLTCTWKDGLPNHVFTVDDKMEEVYVASLSRTGRFNDGGRDKGSDYVYTFRSKKKEFESQSIGTMRVSTSIMLGSNKSSEVTETRFILSLKDPTDEILIGNRDCKFSKRLKSKVAKVFRSSHSSIQRPGTSFSGSSPIFEDSLWDPSDTEDRGKRKSVGNCNHAPNLELGAIIVREVCKNREEDTGGWGLKFLKKSGKDASVKPVLPSERSTSLDILIPAGLHGGPRTRGGGPSSLVQRWVSGGRCDCGGWDIGCPLSVLSAGPSGANSSVVVDNFVVECNSVDLFMQGSKQDVPTFKMANIHDGLYYIQFRSSLSTLQSFAIAAAIIHSRSPVLRFKVYRT